MAEGKNILLTGGMGYIGSHTAVLLSEEGWNVVLLDNLSNSDQSVLSRLERLTGKTIDFVEADVRDTERVEHALKEYSIDAVIHFAGLKAVGESVEMPIEYFDNNITGTISLLKAMKAANVKSLVFSSSATVYGEPQYLPYDEKHPTLAVNPYGRSKLHIEQMLNDVAASDAQWRICCLRYFNPVGAHESGLIGENPNGIPNNLMPYICQVAEGKLPHLNVFGDDYPTKDGTGVRDYIHVMDLAEGHKKAIDYLADHVGWTAINLGTGCGYSVLEMVKTFENATDKLIPYQIADRRLGDLPEFFANPSKANTLLDWQAGFSLNDMCQSAWRFQEKQKKDLA